MMMMMIQDQLAWPGLAGRGRWRTTNKTELRRPAIETVTVCEKHVKVKSRQQKSKLLFSCMRIYVQVQVHALPFQSLELQN